MLGGDSSSEGTSTSRGDTDATLNDKHSGAFSASTTGPFSARNSDGDIDNINQLFDGMEFDDVEVAGDGVVLYAEPIGADRRLAILAECASFRLTINGFDPSALTPFGSTSKVVFLRWPTNRGVIFIPATVPQEAAFAIDRKYPGNGTNHWDTTLCPYP